MALPLLTWASMSHTEHLESPAVPFSQGVRFWVWNQAKAGDGLELSENGIFLKTASVESEGQHVTVRLELPNEERFTVLGKVVRTVKGGLIAAAGMGIRFMDLTPSQRQSIGQFVAMRSGAGLIAA